MNSIPKRPARRTRAFVIVWFQKKLEWNDMYRIMETTACEYTVWQTERCPKTKKLHIQGYVHFKSGKTLARVRSIYAGAKILLANGTAKHNKVYCTKVETRVGDRPFGERGKIPPGQGARTDITLMMEDIREGLSDVDMFEKYPTGWAQYRRVLKDYRINRIKPRNFWTKTLVLWGKTGLGKSTRAFWNANNNGSWATMLVPMNQSSMVWGDGTIGADTVVIEDMDGQINFRVLKNMLDKWPMLAPVKGSSMQWAPKYVIITSNVNPQFWYPDLAPEAWNANDNPLCRRLTTQGSAIIHMTEDWKAPSNAPKIEEDPDLDLIMDYKSDIEDAGAGARAVD